jgi:hypothetical protein
MQPEMSPQGSNAPTPEPVSGDRRLYHRYPAGLSAVLEVAGRSLPCRLTDISLGGACVEVEPGSVQVELPAEAALRAPALADGHRFGAVIRRLTADRVHLAFDLDDRGDYELTMFLMGSAARLGGVDAAGDRAGAGA